MAERPTFETAKLCPKCGKPGDDRKQYAGPNRSTLHMVYCVTELCPWYDTCWTVQVNRDGTIPPPQDHSRSPKVYQGFEDHDYMARQINEALQLQLQMETDPDPSKHEIRNPRSE